MGNEMRQDQNQEVKFEHRAVWKVRCEFFTNSDVARIEAEMEQIRTQNPRFFMFKNELEKAKLVDVITHEGKVTKAICHLFKDGKCTSKKNEGNNCHIYSLAAG